LFVPGLLVLQAVPDFAEQGVGEVSQGGVVVVAGGSAAVVVGSDLL
jgi:hypothetical protein